MIVNNLETSQPESSLNPTVLTLTLPRRVGGQTKAVNNLSENTSQLTADNEDFRKNQPFANYQFKKYIQSPHDPNDNEAIQDAKQIVTQ
jgi:hypothetical protein